MKHIENVQSELSEWLLIIIPQVIRSFLNELKHVHALEIRWKKPLVAGLQGNLQSYTSIHNKFISPHNCKL